jgi:hypothetical protein
MLVITLIALAIAVAVAVYAWRLLQEERRRSEARIAVLMAELAASANRPTALADDLSLAAEPAPAPRPARPAAEPAPPVFERDFLRHDASSAAREEAAIFSQTEVSAGSSIFGSAEASDAPRSPWLAAAVIAAILAGAGGIAYFALGERHVGATSPLATTAAAPVELVSLSHRRDGEGLIVQGLVRNPVAGQELREVNASVFFFDAQGSFLTTVKAPLDFRTLAAGDESPFSARLAASRGVRRYRVSFRDVSGRLVPHVDRREAVPGTR